MGRSMLIMLKIMSVVLSAKIARKSQLLSSDLGVNNKYEVLFKIYSINDSCPATKNYAYFGLAILSDLVYNQESHNSK